MIIPPIPTFTEGETSLTNLQELSAAVSFIVDASQHPMTHIFRVSGPQTLTASTWTTLTGATVAYDPDNMMNGVTSFAPVIKTMGYYSFEGCVPFGTSATASTTLAGFLFTAGGNNPNFTTGTTVRFGVKGGSSVATANEDTTYCPSAMAPACLYKGDTVALQAWSSVSFTININNNSSYISGRFVPNLTAYLVRVGP